MSYYRYITGVYKSYQPALNRPLRSSSVPRHVPELRSRSRTVRASSVPPLEWRYSATPFRARAMSVTPAVERFSFQVSRAFSSAPEPEVHHYTDFDCKVIDYMSRLERQDDIKTYVSEAKHSRGEAKRGYSHETSSSYQSPSFQSRYSFYDGAKHERDYLYPVTREVLGSWKHFNLSRSTLDERHRRDTSPLVSRELDRYFGTQRRNDYLGSISSGCATDFRHYNYRRVPYLGGSDHYSYLNKQVMESLAVCQQ